MTEVAPRVHRLGTRLVNWYVIEDDGGLTVIDAGMPAHRPMLDQLLSRLGRSLSDVAAVVLTHPHVDHIGFAESLRTEAEVPVFVHGADEDLAREGKQPKRERSMLPPDRGTRRSAAVRARRAVAGRTRPGGRACPRGGSDLAERSMPSFEFDHVAVAMRGDPEELLDGQSKRD